MFSPRKSASIVACRAPAYDQRLAFVSFPLKLQPKQATAAKYHERMEHERKAREDAAKSIVMGLGDGLDSFDSDVLASIADGIESVLKAPVRSDSQE